MSTLVIKTMNSARPNVSDESGPVRDKALCVRTSDMGGTDYALICYLTSEQAAAISGEHTGIDGERGDAEPAPLMILREKNRAVGAVAWVLSIKGEIASRLDDDKVRDLIKMGKPVFEKGQPDWDSRKIEDMEDRIDEAKKNLASLEARRDRMVDERKAKSVETARDILGQILRMTVTEGDPDIETLEQDAQALNGLISLCRDVDWSVSAYHTEFFEVMPLMVDISMMGQVPEDADIETLEQAHGQLDHIIRKACEIKGVEPVVREAQAEPGM